MKDRAPEKRHLSQEERLALLDQLYERHNDKAIEFVFEGLIVRYIEIDSSEVEELDDKKLMAGAFTYAFGILGLKTKIFVLRDKVPEKFRRYCGIHETVESVWSNHWYAVQDEFRAAQEELSPKEFLEYCQFRLLYYQEMEDICTIKEMRKWVSPKIRQMLTMAQKNLGITKRRNIK